MLKDVKILATSTGWSTSSGYAINSGDADTVDGKHASEFEPTLSKGNLTATAPMHFDQTRQVIGGGAVASLTNDLGATITSFSTDITLAGNSQTDIPTEQAVKTYADNLVLNLLDYRGGYSASGNVFPTSTGSGPSGTILKGDLWIISSTGTLGAQVVQIGDSIIASVDSPGQVESKWNFLNGNISYVPEDVANKKTSLAENSDTYYPTQRAVKTAVDAKQNTLTTGNLTASAPLNQSGGTGAVIGSGVALTIDEATTSQKGAVQLSNSYTNTSTGLAVTEKALSDGLGTKQNTLSTGNLTASSPIALDQTRQIIGGAAVISHSTSTGYKHIPTAGSANQILKNSGTAGEGAWGTVTENTGALAAVTTIAMSGVLTSTLAAGTAPFTIASSTGVTNLNADMVDGSHASEFVLKTLYDADSVVTATSNDTPIVTTMAEQTVLGRLAGGHPDDIAIGIADNNMVQVDDASVSSGEYARWTANGVEGVTHETVASEVQSHIKLDDLATPDANTDLNANTTNHGLLLQATAPAAGLYNYVGITNAETAYTNKALFDATVPTTVAESASPAAGSAAVAARRDHTHGAPATYAPTAHNIFSASHGDIAANASPVDGDIIIGNVTPKWSKLAISIPATDVLNVLSVANAELRPSWRALFDATNPAALGSVSPGTSLIAAHRDHIHAQDAILKSVLVEKGDILYASAASTAAVLTHGTVNQLLKTGGDAGIPAWSTVTESSGTLGMVTAITDGGADITIENNTSDKDIIFKVLDGAVDTEVMRIYGSASNLGIGVADPDTKLEVFYAGTQLKLSFDATDNATLGVDTNGDLTITPSGDEVIIPATKKLTLSMADGTAPIVCTSTTKIANMHVARATLADGIPIAVASGTDIITATFSPAITLSNMTVCMIVAAGANTTTTPTFNPNTLGALTICRKGGVALVAGDIPGALSVCILEYNLANTRWELVNPAVPCYQ